MLILFYGSYLYWDKVLDSSLIAQESKQCVKMLPHVKLMIQPILVMTYFTYYSTV